MNELILSALESLKNNKLRTFLTTLGVVIGISSVILIVSIGQGAVKFINNELNQFGTDYFSINPGKDLISAFSNPKTLTLEDAKAIENDSSLTNIKTVGSAVIANVKATANGEEETVVVEGISREIFGIFRMEPTHGEFFTEADELSLSRVVVMGKNVVEKFFGKDTNPVGEKINIDGKSFKVIADFELESVLAGSLNDMMFVPINVVLDQILGQDYLAEIDISVYDTEIVNQTIQDVEILLRDRHDIKEEDDDDFIITSAESALTTTETITNLLTLVIAAISGISLIVGGIGVMNIMLVTVTERTREIGLLKSIGATQKNIWTQFLVESVVISLVGGIIGISLGILGAFVIAWAVGMPFVVSIASIIIAAGVASLVGIIFGIYPAKRAARLNPIDALRHE
ncbi:MAG: ABC transporter permease [bacterium]